MKSRVQTHSSSSEVTRPRRQSIKIFLIFVTDGLSWQVPWYCHVTVWTETMGWVKFPFAIQYTSVVPYGKLPSAAIWTWRNIKCHMNWITWDHGTGEKKSPLKKNSRSRLNYAESLSDSTPTHTCIFNTLTHKIIFLNPLKLLGSMSPTVVLLCCFFPPIVLQLKCFLFLC